MEGGAARPSPGGSAQWKAVYVAVVGNESTDGAKTKAVRDDVLSQLPQYADVYCTVTRDQLVEHQKLRKGGTDAAGLVQALKAITDGTHKQCSTAEDVLQAVRVEVGAVAEAVATKKKKGQLDEAQISKLLGRDKKPVKNPHPRAPVNRIMLLQDFPANAKEAEAVLALKAGALHGVLDLRRTYDGEPVARETAKPPVPSAADLGAHPRISAPVERRQEVAGEVIDFGAPPPEPEPEPEPESKGEGEGEGEGEEGEGKGEGEEGEGGEAEDGGEGEGGDAAADEAEPEPAAEAEAEATPAVLDDDEDDDSEGKAEPEPEPEPELPPEEEVVIETKLAGVDLWRMKANSGGVWDDVDFAAIVVDDFRGVVHDLEQLVPTLHARLAKMAKDRQRFEAWLKVPAVAIPEAAAAAEGEGKEQQSDSSLAQRAYELLLQDLPTAAVDASMVTFALREAVAIALGGESKDDELDDPVPAPLRAWAGRLDTCVAVEEGDSALATACRGAFSVCKAPKDVLVGAAVVEAAEEDAEEEGKAQPLQLPMDYTPFPAAAAGRAVASQASYPGAAGRLGMPATPPTPETERGANATELLTFSTLPEFAIRRAQALREVERLLQAGEDGVAPEELRAKGKSDPDSYSWQLHEWRWYQRRSAHSLQQAFSDALATDPEVRSCYLPAQDRLVVAVHHPTPRVRHRDTVFSAAVASSVPLTFARWQGEGLNDRPEWAAEPVAFFDVDLPQLANSTHLTRRVFPADHSLVRLQRHSTGPHWLSITKSGHLFGLRHGKGPRPGQTVTFPAAPAASGSGSGAGGVMEGLGGERGFGAGPAMPEVSNVRAGKGGSGEGFPYRFYASFGATKTAGPSQLVVDEGPAAPAKPDGKGTVVAINTCATGLVVESCSAGWVRQTPAEPLQHTSSGPREVGRVATGTQASTVVHFEGGYKKLLFADGSVEWFMPAAAEGSGAAAGAEAGEGKWLVVAPDGSRFFKVGAKQVSTDPVQLTFTTDVESGAKVTVRHDPCPITGKGAAGGLDRMRSKRSKRSGGRRGNKAKAKRRQQERDAAIAKYWEERKELQGGSYTASAPDGGLGGRVVLVEYTNGDRLVIHADGTHIATTKGVLPEDARPGEQPGRHVVVSCPGYATVEVDVAMEAVSQRHSQGKRASITRSGMQTRSVAYLPDGTLVAIDYDTKITSTYNGQVRVHKPDGVICIARDGGMVEYRPAGATDSLAAAAAVGCGNVQQERYWSPEDEVVDDRATPRSVRSEVDVETGSYDFDLEVGDCMLTDPESNSFQLFMSGHIVTDLAGQIGGLSVIPRIAEPVPPRVFCADGSGEGGEELMPPRAFEQLKATSVPGSERDGFWPMLVYSPQETEEAARALSVRDGEGEEEPRVMVGDRTMLGATDFTAATGASLTLQAQLTQQSGQGVPPLAMTQLSSPGATAAAAAATSSPAQGQQQAQDAGLDAYIGKTVCLPATLAPAPYCANPGAQQDSTSINHTFLTLTTGPGEGAGSGAAVAPGRRSAAVQHAAGIHVLPQGWAGLVSRNGRPEVRCGTQGWIGFITRTATGGAASMAVPQLVASRPPVVGATRLALQYIEVTEHEQLDVKQRASLERDEAACEQWRKDVAATINRFAVDDHREDDVRVEEIMVARRILKQRAPKRKKKRGNRRRFAGGGGRHGGRKKAAAQASVLQSVDEGTVAASPATTVQQLGSSPRVEEDDDDVRLEEPEGKGSDTIAVGSSAAGDEHNEASEAALAAKARAEARQRARERAQQRSQARRQQRSDAVVGSFWGTSTGKQIAAAVASGESPRRSAPQYPEADSPGRSSHVAGAGVAAVRRLSNRNLLDTTEDDASGSMADTYESKEGGMSDSQLLGAQDSFRTTLAKEAFAALPASVDFGELVCGRAYRSLVKLHNTSLQPARFRVDVGFITHSAAGNSVRLVATPGNIAPGMVGHVEVEVMPRVLGSCITTAVVKTEAGSIEIPVNATVVRSLSKPLREGVWPVVSEAEQTTLSSFNSTQDPRPRVSATTASSRGGSDPASALSATDPYMEPIDGQSSTFDDAKAEQQMLKMLRD